MIEVDAFALCAACGNDLAAEGLRLCASCAAAPAALLIWARAHDWPRLDLRAPIAVAEGEESWLVFLGYPGNASLWPLALAQAGLALPAAV